jgi:glucose/arabinose dehydrogenase
MPSRLIGCLALLTALLCVSCGGGSDSNAGGNGDVVPGTTRLGWDQVAASASEVASLHFVIYIDDVRSELPGASCSTPAGSAGFPCVATLPAMTSGQHTIQLASYIPGDVLLESPKSAPLVITVSSRGAVTSEAATAEAGGSAPVVASPSSVRDLVTSDGVRLHPVVAAAVERPSALAIADDGTMVVGRHAGGIRVLRGGALVGETALADDATADVGVLDVALDPAFARTHLLYVLDTVPGPPASFRLARYREVDGRLGERAVMLDGVPSSPLRPSGALTFGGDAQLYVALDDGGEGAPRAASYNGKVMRLTADGRTPPDQPASGPLFASNLRAPRSLAWDATGTSLWVADAGAERLTRLRTRERRTTTATAYRVPLTQGPASAVVYRGALMPAFAGDLLVASVEDSPSILRVRLGNGDTVIATEPLTVLGSGSIRAVKVGPDGALYALTDDAVLRITPR